MRYLLRSTFCWMRITLNSMFESSIHSMYSSGSVLVCKSVVVMTWNSYQRTVLSVYDSPSAFFICFIFEVDELFESFINQSYAFIILLFLFVDQLCFTINISLLLFGLTKLPYCFFSCSLSISWARYKNYWQARSCSKNTSILALLISSLNENVTHGVLV